MSETETQPAQAGAPAEDGVVRGAAGMPEPAAATAYPGASSQKYLMEVSAFGHAWIS